MGWLLEYEHVTYTYPHAPQPSLDDLTLRIPKGRRCAILGPNGCGKSTLLLHANGIYRPQQGVLKWKGEKFRYDRTSLARLRRQVGLVLQDPEQQIVASTVAEDLSYGLCNAGLPDEEVKRRVLETAARFQLAELLARPVHQLSLGQKKQLALAGVMAMRPELLLLDEPTAGLDWYHSRLLLDELARIEREGTTIVMATHDLDLVYAWADWVVVLERGRQVLEGKPAEVFAQRARLEQMHLGVPLLYEVWQALPAEMLHPAAEPPRTSQQLIQLLAKRNVT
ncbi:energy-coupling factor ABC transporter ATP-binding protein [Brevibacillus marinus]|uniref:energy-coupling factor ABC transporter ATP-binding protein n=1 Tax=Brevibacillus marinus TaxID=2496837 RepID=UPI000F82BCBD|nr:ABC transporter ATP-binding protein [Brevibacillus marinus]